MRDEAREITVDNVHERMLALIDRALTSPTRATAYAARWAPATAVEYVRAAVELKAWCRPPSHGDAPPRWLTPMPCTPETLALFAEYQLVELGRAPATVRKAVAGVRAWHRLHGAPVPDGIPALAVLTDHEATLRAGGWEPRHAQPMPLADLVRLLDACDPSEPRGMRNAALLLYGYAGMMTAGRLVELRVRDADELAARLPHWSIGGRHDPARCPVERPLPWARYLTGRGATGEQRLMRGIDQHGRVAGLDPEWTGRQSPDGRMDTGSLGDAFAAMLENPAPYRLFSLRAGGLVHRRRQGTPLVDLAEEGQLSPRSTVLLGYVQAAETWPSSAAAAVVEGDTDGAGSTDRGAHHR